MAEDLLTAMESISKEADHVSAILNDASLDPSESLEMEYLIETVQSNMSKLRQFADKLTRKTIVVSPMKEEVLVSADDLDVTIDCDDSDVTVDGEATLDHEADTEDMRDVDDVMKDFFEDDDDLDACALEQLDEAEKSFFEEHMEEQAREEYDPSQQPAEQKYLNVLKQYFGYSAFRPLQWKIINSVLNDKRDNCVIMATGYGKSLCYQYPSVFSGRTSIVISPLISLMQDQVLSLKSVNVEACFLGSAQEETANVKHRLLAGEYRVVYLTPEFVESSSTLISTLDKNVGVDLVAIDEAHCVSQWGHDFRSAYRQLGTLRQKLPNVPIMALTATATPEVRRDICISLKLKNPIMTCSSFDRPNLFLRVHMKSSAPKDLRSELMEVGGKLSFGGPAIIYCPTKKASEEALNVVKMLGVSCGLYHAGLPFSERKKTHKQFISDEISCVVATVAFGMGIDKPDVRKIIHYGAPKDIEAYYQEMGRAGRDGDNSDCVVYYSPADFNISRFLLKDVTSEKFKTHKLKMLQKMESYLATTKCRRRTILSHFEDKDVTDVGGTNRCCDNCSSKLSDNDHMDEEKDYGKEAYWFLSAVQATGGRYGVSVPIFLIRGSTNQRLPATFHSHELHGKGKARVEKWWKAFARQLMNAGYLKDCPIVGGFGSTVELTDKGVTWLSRQPLSSPSMKMTPNLELKSMENAATANIRPGGSSLGPSILPSVPTNVWLSSRQSVNLSSNAAQRNPEVIDSKQQQLQMDLYAKLIILRNEIADETSLPSYRVFSNKNLLDMAKFRPTSLHKLQALEDVAKEKANVYGTRFLSAISQFCNSNSISTDTKPKENLMQHNATLDNQQKSLFMKMSETARMSYSLYEEENKAVESVASIRGLKTSTIFNHLSEAIKIGLPLDIDRLGISARIIDLITNVIRQPPINSDISRLTPIKDQLPDHVQFHHIKVVIAILQRRYGSPEGASVIPLGSADKSASVTMATTSRSSNNNSQKSSQGSQREASAKRKLPAWMVNSQSSPSSGPKKVKKKGSLFSK